MIFTLRDIDPNGVFITQNVVGSRLQGTETDQSDWDRVTIYAADPYEIAGQGARKTQQRVDVFGDHTFYEIGTLISLALKANPTALEALFSDKPLATTGGDVWDHFSRLRELVIPCLRPTSISSAANGYAWASLKQARTGKRVEKNLRHSALAVQNATLLLQTGIVHFRGFGKESVFQATEEDIVEQREFLESLARQKDAAAYIEASGYPHRASVSLELERLRRITHS